MMLFSATYDQQVMIFAEAIIPNPVTIRLRREEESLDNIKQYYVLCRHKEDKFQSLANIYGVITVGQAMIFCHVSEGTCTFYTFSRFYLDMLVAFFVNQKMEVHTV